MPARKPRRAPTRAQKLESWRGTLTLAIGPVASFQIEGLSVADVPELIQWAVLVKRELVTMGLGELDPYEVTAIPAERVDVPEDDGEDYIVVPEERRRVGF